MLDKLLFNLNGCGSNDDDVTTVDTSESNQEKDPDDITGCVMRGDCPEEDSQSQVKQPIITVKQSNREGKSIPEIPTGVTIDKHKCGGGGKQSVCLGCGWTGNKYRDNYYECEKEPIYVDFVQEKKTVYYTFSSDLDVEWEIKTGVPGNEDFFLEDSKNKNIEEITESSGKTKLVIGFTTPAYQVDKQPSARDPAALKKLCNAAASYPDYDSKRNSMSNLDHPANEPCFQYHDNMYLIKVIATINGNNYDIFLKVGVEAPRKKISAEGIFLTSYIAYQEISNRAFNMKKKGDILELIKTEGNLPIQFYPDGSGRVMPMVASDAIVGYGGFADSYEIFEWNQKTKSYWRESIRGTYAYEYYINSHRNIYAVTYNDGFITTITDFGRIDENTPLK